MAGFVAQGHIYISWKKTYILENFFLSSCFDEVPLSLNI